MSSKNSLWLSNKDLLSSISCPLVIQTKPTKNSKTGIKRKPNMNFPIPSCVAVFPVYPWPPPALSGSSGHVCSFSWLWNEESPTHKDWIKQYKQQHKDIKREVKNKKPNRIWKCTSWNHEPCQEKRSSWPQQHSRLSEYVSSYPPVQRSSEDRHTHRPLLAEMSKSTACR